MRLGVGKNMAQSIRFWGRVCGVFERAEGGAEHRATSLGRALLEREDAALEVEHGAVALHPGTAVEVLRR